MKQQMASNSAIAAFFKPDPVLQFILPLLVRPHRLKNFMI
jgi:hypothetical protein